MSIPLHDLQTQYRHLKPGIDAGIQRVLDHCQFILGPEVAQLEERLASFANVPHCITCASGTDALLIALMGLGVGPGDEVITPAFTFIATAEVIALVGAVPVFVDVEATTCNLDPMGLQRAITSRTRAIMPVSLYGQPADMDAINAIAAVHGIPVIEDAAQSFGAQYRGRRSCGLSTVGCTSFFPSKPLGCYGDGGAIFTADPVLAQAMREIRVHGQSRRYHHTRIGLAGRMDTMQCAVVLAKLDAFEREIAARIDIGGRYAKFIRAANAPITPVTVAPDRTSVFAQYTVLVEERARIQSALSAAGIPTAVHYPTPIHRQPAYQQWGANAKCPVSEHLASHVLSLPMHAYLEEATQRKIVDALAEAVGA